MANTPAQRRNLARTVAVAIVCGEDREGAFAEDTQIVALGQWRFNPVKTHVLATLLSWED